MLPLGFFVEIFFFFYEVEEIRILFLLYWEFLILIFLRWVFIMWSWTQPNFPQAPQPIGWDYRCVSPWLALFIYLFIYSFIHSFIQSIKQS
jgi:hypothetical protein